MNTFQKVCGDVEYTNKIASKLHIGSYITKNFDIVIIVSHGIYGGFLANYKNLEINNVNLS